MKNGASYFSVTASGCKSVTLSLIVNPDKQPPPIVAKPHLSCFDVLSHEKSNDPVTPSGTKLLMPNSATVKTLPNPTPSVMPQPGALQKSKPQTHEQLAQAQKSQKSTSPASTHHAPNETEESYSVELVMDYSAAAQSYEVSLELPPGRHCFKYIFGFEDPAIPQKVMSAPGFACYMNGFAVFYIKGDRLSPNPIKEVQKEKGSFHLDYATKKKISDDANKLFIIYNNMRFNELTSGDEEEKSSEGTTAAREDLSGLLYGSDALAVTPAGNQATQDPLTAGFNIDSFLQSHRLATTKLDLQFMAKAYNKSQPFDLGKKNESSARPSPALSSSHAGNISSSGSHLFVSSGSGDFSASVKPTEKSTPVNLIPSGTRNEKRTSRTFMEGLALGEISPRHDGYPQYNTMMESYMSGPNISPRGTLNNTGPSPRSTAHNINQPIRPLSHSVPSTPITKKPEEDKNQRLYASASKSSPTPFPTQQHAVTATQSHSYSPYTSGSQISPTGGTSFSNANSSPTLQSAPRSEFTASISNSSPTLTYPSTSKERLSARRQSGSRGDVKDGSSSGKDMGSSGSKRRSLQDTDSASLSDSGSIPLPNRDGGDSDFEDDYAYEGYLGNQNNQLLKMLSCVNEEDMILKRIEREAIGGLNSGWDMFDVPDSEFVKFSSANIKKEDDERKGTKDKDKQDEELTNLGDALQMYSYTVNDNKNRYRYNAALEDSGAHGYGASNEEENLYSAYTASDGRRRSASYDTDTDSYSYTSRSNSASNANPLAKSGAKGGNSNNRSQNIYASSDSHSEYVDDDIRTEPVNGGDRSRSNSNSNSLSSTSNLDARHVAHARPPSGHERVNPRAESVASASGKEARAEKSASSHTLPIAKGTSKKRSPSLSPSSSPAPPTYVKLSTLDKETKEFIDNLTIAASHKLLLTGYLEKYDYSVSSLMTLSLSLLEKALLDAQLPPLVCGHVVSALDQVRQATREELSVDWNKPYQVLDAELYDINSIKRSKTKPSLFERYKLYLAMHELYDTFVQTAVVYGKLIISEMGLPEKEKTILPDTRYGGLAGGHKMTKHGILFKFANDSTKIYGGDIEAAMKVAGHDLRSLVQIRSLNIPDIKLPMMVLIDYLGFRLVAESILPINKETLILGSSDGGNEVRHPFVGFDGKPIKTEGITHLKEKTEFVRNLNSLGDRLHLAEHRVAANITLNTPIDLEGHLLPNGDCYILDYSRLFPPEVKSSSECPYAHLFRLLRPEFVRSYPVYLSSDGYSNFKFPRMEEEAQQHNRELDNAVTFLHQTIIPSFAQRLLMYESQGKLCAADGTLLIQILHAAGVNCRHLGIVLHHLTLLNPESMWIKIVWIEMVSRLLKCKLRYIMRTTLNNLGSMGKKGKRSALKSENGRMGTSLNKVYYNIVFYLNLIFGNDVDSELHWKTTLRDELVNKFGSLWMNDSYTTKNKENNLKILNAVCQMTGIVISSGTLEIIAKRESKEISFWDLPNPFDVVDIEDIHARTKQTTDGASAGATIIRYEACNTSENEDKKMAKLGLAIKQYKKILTVNPRCSHVLYHIADCYCHLAYLYLNSTANSAGLSSNANGANQLPSTPVVLSPSSSSLKSASFTTSAPLLTATNSQKLAHHTQREHKEQQNRLLQTMMSSSVGVPLKQQTQSNVASKEDLTNKYKCLAEEFYRVACDADPRDWLASHKYALFLEVHKTCGDQVECRVEISRISDLYYQCVSANPKYINGLFDYGRFLVTKCGIARGFEFMEYALQESDNDRSLSVQLSILRRDYFYVQ